MIKEIVEWLTYPVFSKEKEPEPHSCEQSQTASEEPAQRDTLGNEEVGVNRPPTPPPAGPHGGESQNRATSFDIVSVLKPPVLAAGWIALIYGFGFIIVNSYLHEFGIRQNAGYHPSYLLAGLGFFLAVFLPAVVLFFVPILFSTPYPDKNKSNEPKALVQKPVDDQQNRNSLLKRVSEIYYWLRESVAVKRLMFFSLVGSILILYIYLTFAFLFFIGQPEKNILALYPRSYLQSSWMFPLVVFMAMWFLMGFGIGALRVPRLKLSERKMRLHVLSAIALIALVAPMLIVMLHVWSVTIYQDINHAFGGGDTEEGRVQIIFKQNNKEAQELQSTLKTHWQGIFDESLSSELFLIKENEDWIIVRDVNNGARRNTVIKIPQSVINGVVYSQD